MRKRRSHGEMSAVTALTLRYHRCTQNDRQVDGIGQGSGVWEPGDGRTHPVSGGPVWERAVSREAVCHGDKA